MIETAVRLGAAQDLASAASVDALAVPGSERWISLAAFLDGSRGWCLLAGPAGRPEASAALGYVAVAPRRFFGRDFVELLVVAEAHRGNGVGRELLAAAVSRAETSTIFTSTNESNRPMRALLGATGWSVSGALTGLDDADPEIVFYRTT